MGMGGLSGWDSNVKVSCFLGDYARKTRVFRGVTCLVPRLSCVGKKKKKKRAWHTLYVHDQFLQNFLEF